MFLKFSHLPFPIIIDSPNFISYFSLRHITFLVNNDDVTMKVLKDFYFENPFLKSYIDGATAVIKILKNPFEIITEIDLSEKLLNLIQYASDTDSIHSLLVLTEMDCCNETNYDNFLSSIFIENQTDESLPQIKGLNGRGKRARQINLLDQFIIKIVDFSKISVVGLQGGTVTPFIGASLAADFRCVSRNTVLSFSHVKHGIHPTGALPFFLSKYLTPSECKKYLFTGGEIDAETALELKLIDKIFESEDFENECLEYLRSLNKINLNVIKSTKQLMNIKQDLINYFDSESRLFFS